MVVGTSEKMTSPVGRGERGTHPGWWAPARRTLLIGQAGQAAARTHPLSTPPAGMARFWWDSLTHCEFPRLQGDVAQREAQKRRQAEDGEEAVGDRPLAAADLLHKGDPGRGGGGRRGV